MPDSPRRLRLRRALRSTFVVSIALAGLTATPAHAEKVTALKAWDSDNLYYVKADLDGRVRPEAEPRAVIDHVREGDWVRITCQVRGELAYGSDLWDKVDGYYVPDAYIRTHTSGTLSGAPRCTPPAPSPRLRSQMLADAGWIMNKTYTDFLEYKGWAARGNNPFGFIWDDNGCSDPWYTKPLTGAWAQLFDGPCQLHDFGYRNYGTGGGDGLGLSPDDATREWIDKRLRTEIDRLCADRFPRGLGRNDCLFYSQAFYLAVRAKGDDRFF